MYPCGCARHEAPIDDNCFRRFVVRLSTYSSSSSPSTHVPQDNNDAPSRQIACPINSTCSLDVPTSTSRAHATTPLAVELQHRCIHLHILRFKLAAQPQAFGPSGATKRDVGLAAREGAIDVDLHA